MSTEGKQSAELAERVLALADDWEGHSRLFSSPSDSGTREDWEFVARRLREVVAEVSTPPEGATS